jgi:periplasmic protein TonB
MKSASLVLAAAVLVQAGVLSASAQERPSKDVQAPRVVREYKPNYPDSAKQKGIRGNVELEVVVKKDGTVGDVKVKKSLDAELDEEAVRAMKKWEFKPGTKERKPVDVLVDVEMTFNLK